MNFNKTVNVLSAAVKNLSDYNNGSLSGQALMSQTCFTQLNTELDIVWHEVLAAPSYQRNPALRANKDQIDTSRRILDDLQSHITSGNIELFKLNSPAELIALSSTIRTFDTVSGNIQAVGTDAYSYLGLDELRQLSAAIQATISLLSISYDLGNR